MDALEICALKLGAFPRSTVRRLPGAEADHAGAVRRAEDTRLGRRREPRVSRRKMALIRGWRLRLEGCGEKEALMMQLKDLTSPKSAIFK